MREAKSECANTGGLVCGIEAPLRKMGNIQTATITIQSEVVGSENRYNASGVKPCSRVSVSQVVLSLSLLCSKTDNMNLSLQSETFEPDPTVGYIQEFTLCDSSALAKGNFFVFEKSGVVQGSLVATILDPGPATIATLTEGTDFIFTPHGIELLQDLVIAGAAYLRLTYTYDDTGLDEFNFLSEFQGPRYLYFKGTNYGDGDEAPLGVEIYKVLFSPLSQLDLISQGNYFLLNLTGQIEIDYAKKDLGLGGYFKLRRG